MIRYLVSPSYTLIYSIITTNRELADLTTDHLRSCNADEIISSHTFPFSPFLDANVTRVFDGPRVKSGSDFPFSEMLERTGKYAVEPTDFGVLCGSSHHHAAINNKFACSPTFYVGKRPLSQSFSQTSDSDHYHTPTSHTSFDL